MKNMQAKKKTENDALDIRHISYVQYVRMLAKPPKVIKSTLNKPIMLFEDNTNQESEHTLPFYPTFHLNQEFPNISVWWFETNFCQSKFGKNCKKGTNSCTLIVILTASKLASEQVETFARFNRLPHAVITVFGRAILEANAIYAGLDAAGRITNVNFNIPEAMDILSDGLVSSLQEWFFVHVHIPTDDSYKRTTSIKLSAALKDGLHMWHMLDFKKDFIFVVLIADSRSILLCFQLQNKIATMFDSHCHPNVAGGHGAVIVQTEWKYLQSLTFWIAEMFSSVYNCRPKVFELSFLPLKD